MEQHPLLDEIDLEILMHKDAHFGGSFPVMIEYYEEDKVGVQEDFDLSRIKQLAAFDKDGHLSAEMLPDVAKNEVIFAKELYKKFRDCYEEQDELPKKLADLILAEEYEPVKEIEALSSFKKRAVKPLVEILQQDHFYNPLNPGYGIAPIHAALSLKQIGNKEAIPHLFHALGKSFSVDEIIIDTLISFGKDAEDFLCDRLQGSPYTKDNYLAALALSSFPVKDETAELALHLLSKKESYDHPSFVSYLICICEGLENEAERAKFRKISASKNLPEAVKNEMQVILGFWKS